MTARALLPTAGCLSLLVLAGCTDGVGFRDPDVGAGGTGLVAPPTPRGGAAAAWMPGARALAIFGGMAPITGETFVFSADTPGWSELTPDPAPADRCHHSFVAVPERDQALLFGGFSFGGRFNDTWRFDLATGAWTELATTGPAPAPRCLHAAALAGPRQEMIVFGGIHGGGGAPGDFFADTHVLDLPSQQWTRLDVTGPSAREGAAMVYVPAQDVVYLWGGKSFDVYTSELWRFDLDARVWSEVPTSGLVPTGREDPALFFDEARGRLVIFSGRNDGVAGALLADQIELDLATFTWRELDAGKTPAPRWRASVAVDPEGDRGYMFGGWRDFGGADAFADTWALDLATGTWTEL